MILHKVELHNFGIYGEDASFNLTPESGERYQRPIILFRGKNGVGKSTLVEAIRLCLHGKLSLGGRTRQRDYEAYLQQRLHRDENGDTAVSAHIALEFEHVLLGRRHHYRVQRAWGMNAHAERSRSSRRLTTNLNIWIDDELLDESDDEKEYLLRELVPVGVAELFFFDGEKIATLSEEGADSADLLAETVKNLLGLHLVEQLDRDLDVYLTRQTGIRELQTYQTELAQLHDEETELAQKREDIRAQLAECRRQLNRKRDASTLLEERIAREGGRYAENQNARETERQSIAAAIAQVEQEIYELSRGVMPFAVAPNLLRAVQTRLRQEAAYERWQASQPVLQEIRACIVKEARPAYDTTNTAGTPREQEQSTLITRLQELLQNYSEPPIAKDDVVHHVSAETRGVLLNWIDEALTTAPRQLAAALQKRKTLQAQLKAVEETLSRV
ncbi:MAG: AAA family ATPase, partial [Anaerolineae bacterium]